MRVSRKKSMILKRGYAGCKPPGIWCGKMLLQTHIYLLPHLAKHSVPHTEGKTN